MIRWWGTVVWVFVGAIALAVAVEALLLCDAVGGAPIGQGLLLNEILAGPARDWDGDGVYDSRSDEWLEVQNSDAGPMALDEYRLTDADRTVRFALSGTLAPGEVRLVTGSAAVAWQRSQGLSASGLSLNNSGDTVFLLRVGGRAYLREHRRGERSLGGPRRHPGGGLDPLRLSQPLHRKRNAGRHGLRPHSRRAERVHDRRERDHLGRDQAPL